MTTAATRCLPATPPRAWTALWILIILCALSTTAAAQALQRETRPIAPQLFVEIESMDGTIPGSREMRVRLLSQRGPLQVAGEWQSVSLRCSSQIPPPRPFELRVTTVLDNDTALAARVSVEPTCAPSANLVVREIPDAGQPSSHDAVATAFASDRHLFDFSLLVLDEDPTWGEVATWIRWVSGTVEAAEPVLDVLSIGGASVRASRALLGSRSYMGRIRESAWTGVGRILPQDNLLRRAITFRYSPQGRILVRVWTFASSIAEIAQNSLSLITDRDIRDCRSIGGALHAAALGDLTVCALLNVLDELEALATERAARAVVYYRCRRHPEEWMELGPLEDTVGRSPTLRCDHNGCTARQQVRFH
jgi:hypothetical protein